MVDMLEQAKSVTHCHNVGHIRGREWSTLIHRQRWWPRDLQTH